MKRLLHNIESWVCTTETRLFLVVWLIYAIHVTPGGGVNPNRYFDLIHSLVNERTIYIDTFQENTIDKAFKDGHYYSAGLPGPSLLGIPSYLTFKVLYAVVPNALLESLSNVQSFKQGSAGGFYARDNTDFFLSTIWITWFTLSSFSAIGSVILFRLLLKLNLTRVLALSGTLLYAFGTLIFPYSGTYFSHVFSATLAIGALYFLAKVNHLSARLLWFALGLEVGSMVLIEFWNWVIVGAIGLYVLYRFGAKVFCLYALGLVLPIAVLSFYNILAFGGPLHAAQEFLVGGNRESVHGVGWLGFSFPTPDRIYGLLFSKERGMFLYAPILVLGIVGWFEGLRDKNPVIRDLTRLSVVISTGLVLSVASYEDWEGGASFGPRQILLITPFLFVGVGLALATMPRLIWILLGLLSIAQNWLGSQFGFALDVFEPWQTFLKQGFVLPAISALTSHSQGANPYTLFLVQWGWVITTLYAVVIIASLVWLFESLRQTSVREMKIVPVNST